MCLKSYCGVRIEIFIAQLLRQIMVVYKIKVGVLIVINNITFIYYLYYLYGAVGVSDDEPLLDLEEEISSRGGRGQRGETTEGCQLNLWLQGYMYHYVAEPVIKARWVVLSMRDLC